MRGKVDMSNILLKRTSVFVGVLCEVGIVEPGENYCILGKPCNSPMCHLDSPSMITMGTGSEMLQGMDQSGSHTCNTGVSIKHKILSRTN